MKSNKLRILPIGIAMFSMFFGAGNVVFPLLLGANAGDQALYSILGFLVMGVGIPFLGLFAIILYEGDYRPFFDRIGKIPGFVTVIFLMIMLGPVLAMPRIISLSYTTLQLNMSDMWFNLAACVLLFLLTLREKWVMDILGYILSPLLILSLLVLIVLGLFANHSVMHTSASPQHLFLQGLTNGYNTMDLLAAFFFAAVVYRLLRLKISQSNDKSVNLTRFTLFASLLGATLLGIVYVGFIIIAALHSNALQGLTPDQLIYRTAHEVLGPYASIIANSVFSLACLTTAMVLGVMVSQFIQVRLLRDKVPYWLCLLITYLLTFFFANVGFNDLIAYGAPALSILYPALIMLALCNIAHKLWRFPWVKLPTFLTLAIAFVIVVFR